MVIPSEEVASRILALYPDAIFGVGNGVSIGDRGGGKGVGILSWNPAYGPQPTDEQLAAVDMLPANKGKKYAAIDEHTQAIVERGFLFDGETFSLDPATQTTLTALYAARDALTYPVAFTTQANGSYTIGDPTAMANLCLTALATVKAAVDSGRELKLSVLAAADQAALDAIVDAR